MYGVFELLPGSELHRAPYAEALVTYEFSNQFGRPYETLALQGRIEHTLELPFRESL